MEKKQLYIVMVVSVVMLLGLIGYRWIKGDPDSKKGSKPAATKGMAPDMAAGMAAKAPAGMTAGMAAKPPAGMAAMAPPKGQGKAKAAGPTIKAAKRISAADLGFQGISSVSELRKRFLMAIDRSDRKAAKAIMGHAVGVAARDADLIALGELACEHGFVGQSTRAGKKLLAAGPLKGHLQAYLAGRCDLGQKKAAPALAAFRKAQLSARTDAQRARVLTQLCRVYVDQKQAAAAAGACKGALDKGGDQRAMFHAARLELLRNPKSPKATTLLERAQRLDPTAVDVARALSAHEAILGKPKQAAQALITAGKALSAAKRPQAALKLFTAAKKLLPNLAAVHIGVARAQRALGKEAPAIAAYRRGAELAKGNVEVRVELAQLLAARSVLAAVRVLEDAAQIDPASQPVKAALAKARAALASKQPARAAKQTTTVDGKLLKLVFSNYGGVPTDIILKGKKYREIVKGVGKKGKKGKEQQVNLVRTWHPFWLPMRLDFDGSSFPFPQRYPNWQFQNWDRLRWDGKQWVVVKGKAAHTAKRRGKVVFGYRWPAMYPGMAPPPVVVDRYYEVEPDKSYAWDMEVKVVNRSARKQAVKMKMTLPTVDSEKEKRSMFNPVSLKKEAVCMVGDKVFMRTLSSIRGHKSGCMGCDASACACRRSPTKGKVDVGFSGKVRWAGIDEMYFLFAVALSEKKDTVCQLSDDFRAGKGSKAKTILLTTITFADEQLAHKGSYLSRHFKVYTGPKISEELDKVSVGKTDPKLEESIDYGLFWFIGQPMIWMMKQIQKVVGNWGLAIILLTILIKLLTAPLTMKQMRSMKGMADLKPEIDKLKEKYGDDKQRFQQEMWALYKSHKINPLGGCLPMVLQMPIYIAWYQALMVSVDLYRAPLFGWIHDLTKPDTVHVFGYGVPILPLLMGATMFLQQRMTPTTADNAQAKMMMYMMPAMFTFFMLFLPSGLTLYILTNTLLTMVHQWYMNHTD